MGGITLFLPILMRVVMVLSIAAALYAVWHKINHSCWTAACQDARAELVTAQGQIQAAQERATALALLWAKAINNVEVRYVELAGNRADATANLRERAGRIRHSTGSVSVRVPPDALGVLGDVAGFANDSPAPEGDQGASEAVPDAAGGAETTLDEWIAFAIDAGEAYREAADKHQACVAAYDAVRSDVGSIKEADNGQDQGSD